MPFKRVRFLIKNKKIVSRLAFGGVLVLMSAYPAHAQCSKRLLAFYPEYDDWFYDQSKIPYSQLTHICHFSLDVDPSSGNLTYPNGISSTGNPSLITNAHANNVKVMITVGGADDTNFSAVAANAGYTANFVNQLYTFISTNNYDGVDIDWEFPQSAADKTNAVAFFQAIRNQFNSSPSPAPSWQISFDVDSDSYWGNYINYPALSGIISFFNVMAYSSSGSWNDHTNHNCPVSIM